MQRMSVFIVLLVGVCFVLCDDILLYLVVHGERAGCSVGVVVRVGVE